MRHIAASVTKGTLGVGGAATAILSTVESLSADVKLAGIVVGLLVAILTGISVFFDVLRKWRENRAWVNRPRKMSDEDMP